MDSFLINNSLLLLSSTFCILSSEWVIFILFMEINSFSFTFFLLPKISPMVKYLLIQSVGSLMIIVGVVVSYSFLSSPVSWVFMWCGLMVKMASMPFFFWFISMCLNISWLELFIISTWQKIIPLWFSFLINNSLLLLSSTFCILLGGIYLFNYSSSRMLMILSSISFSGWLILSVSIFSYIFFLTFLIYIMIMLTLIKNMFMNNSFWFTLNDLNWKEKSLLVLFSLGGIPPFVGFIPKWLIIFSFTMLGIFLGLVMVVFSLFNMFCYLKMFSMVVIFKIMTEKSFWITSMMNIVPLMGLMLFLEITHSWKLNKF